MASQRVLAAVALMVAAVPVAADNWPAWRGPDGNGVSKEKDLPLTWSATENVKWKVPLPGPGNSTPVVWGDRVFLVQTTEKGQKRSLMCLSRKDGKLLWEKTVTWTEDDPTHNTNPHGSASPATDGERVVVWHGSAGVYCYDFDGKELWKRDLGKCIHMWGYAASPVIYQDLVILNFGPNEKTFLIAMDRKTGKDVWKVDEVGKPAKEYFGTWSTPVIAKIDGRDQIVMSWPGVVKAHDPKTGEVVWSCTGLEKDKAEDRLVYTSPMVTPDVVVAAAGYGGAAIGLKPGGKGDVTESRRLWRHPTAPQRIGTGVIIGEHAYVLNEPGTLQLVEWKTGKTLWTKRLGGGGGVWGSLVHADGRLYVTMLDGETVVIAAKPEYEELARNPLGERTLASIAVSDGNLFIRTYQHLWCIGK